MTRNQIQFYATASDLATILAEIEARQPIQYTLMGLFPENERRTFFSYSDIDDLGSAPHPTAVANPAYLMTCRGAEITVREVPQDAGGVLFAVDQLANPDTIVVRPGGRHGDNVILYGTVGTVSSTALSKQLYKQVTTAFRRPFGKRREFFVGPEASAAWKAGMRLAMSAMSARSFDLQR